ncbi:MAG: hypothetical protein Q7T82_09280 [Armatimonadota bacterium]|nr:hypothetical protein [Armatimonadota bacterium]
MTRPVLRAFASTLLLALCASFAFAAEGREPPFVQRLRKEGVRLAHLAGAEGSIEAMAKAGCNVMMLQTWSLSGLKKTTPADSEEIVQESDLQKLKASLDSHAKRCKRTNQLALATFYGLSEVEAAILKQHRYELVVDAEGHQSDLIPCPVSRRYWLGFILPQFLTQAKALHQAGAPGGAVIDLEFYGQEAIFAWEWDICYCDKCWVAFCKKTARDDSVAALPPASRGRWVRQRGMARKYRSLMSSRLTALMGEVARECRAVQSDFVLGFYPYVPNWYCDAIIRGWGTPEMPALAMSETEFPDGYRPWSEPRIKHLRATRLDALYVGGMFQGTCYPEAYAAKLEELVRRADGYWLYYSAMFFMPEAAKKLTPPDKGTEYTLAAPPEHYLEALTMANERLDDDRSLVTSFPRKIELIARLKQAGTVNRASAVSIANAGFEQDAKGWNSAHPMPVTDSRFAHSGRRSIRFDPLDGPGRGLSSVTQEVKLTGSAEYVLRLWVRVSGPAEGQGLGMTVYCDVPGGSMGHYFLFQDVPKGKWTRLTRHVSAPTGCNGGALTIRAACPAATIWVDDLEILPAASVVWETDPVELPAGVNCGKLEWRPAAPNAELTVSVHAADSNEKLQWGQQPGLDLSRLDPLSERRFVFRIVCDGPAPTPPVKKLWLETSKRL